MLMGVAAAAAGLVIGTGAKMALPLLRGLARSTPIALATFVGIGVLRWPIYVVLADTCAREHRHRLVGAAMRDDGGTLLALAGYFALMSLFAIGGANSAVPEMYRVAVEVEDWMTDRQFADMFAIAQVTPGPNVIIVTLIGYHVAGVVGALVATLAMCGPTCIFAFYVGGVWDRFKDARWRIDHPGRAGSDLDWADIRECVCCRVGECTELGRGFRDPGDRRRDLHYEVESAVDFRGRRAAGIGRCVLNLIWPDLLSVARGNVLRKKIV